MDVLAAAKFISPLLWLQVHGEDTQPDKQEDRGRGACLIGGGTLREMWAQRGPTESETFLTQLWGKLSGPQEQLASLL